MCLVSLMCVQLCKKMAELFAVQSVPSCRAGVALPNAPSRLPSGVVATTADGLLRSLTWR